METPDSPALHDAPGEANAPLEPAPAADEPEGVGEEDGPPELVEEAALGSTPAGTAANAALRALSRAARSFLLYDPSNDAIRVFLRDYQQATQAALAFGPLDLQMRPFEMVRDSEIVYLERDRERSLAFRMFRDGVRRLTIAPGVEWAELLRLLEILSIRYSGVRQQEDDIVTLLWKAGFNHIEIAAVEGFVPDDDDDDAGAAASRAARAARKADAHFEVPRDWDQPLPDLGEEMATLAYVPIAPDALEALQQEGASSAIGANALRLVEQMLLVVADVTDPTVIQDIVPLMQEVRDFLLSEGQLDALTRMARSIRAFFGEDDEAAEEVLSTFINERAMRRIIGSTARGSDDVPPELIELLDLVPSDHLSNLIALLRTERGTTSRAVIRKLITHYSKTRTQYVITKLGQADSGVAGDLLAAVAAAAPARAMDAVDAVSMRADTELQYEILKVLEGLSFSDRKRKVLMAMLDAPIEDVRMRALVLLLATRESTMFGELVRYVEARAPSKLQPKEAALIGRAMAEINPRSAQRLLSDWIRPRGLFRRFGAVPGQKMLRWTAVSGVGRLAGDKNEQLVRWMAKQAGEDLRRHCMHTLFLRRKEPVIDV